MSLLFRLLPVLIATECTEVKREVSGEDDGVIRGVEGGDLPYAWWAKCVNSAGKRVVMMVMRRKKC